MEEEKPEVEEKETPPPAPEPPPADTGGYGEDEIAVIKNAITAKVGEIQTLAGKLGNEDLAKAANAMLKALG